MATVHEVSLHDLASFGDVAVEDDAVLDYFLATDAVTRIKTGDVFLVLGRKGAGKTALVRHFAEGSERVMSRSLNLGGYPWAVHAQRVDRGASEVEAYVSSWRYLIAVQLAALALSRVENPDADDDARAIRHFLRDNYGSDGLQLDEVLKPGQLRLSSLSFEPTILGCKLVTVALDRHRGDKKLGSELDALSDQVLAATVRLAKRMNAPSLMLHFDELDQGISTLTGERARMLAGLVLAVRSVRQKYREGIPVKPVIYLRSDLWDRLAFSDKNKISERMALRLEWDSDALLELVSARLRAKLGEGARWDTITSAEQTRPANTKWTFVLSRTFLRPRDVIRFLNSALAQARKRDEEPLLLTNADIINARESYSAYLKAELDDEIMAHWPHWDEALQACSALSTLTFQREQFEEEYERRRSKDNPVAAGDALETLFRFSVIGYERRSGYGGSSWAFQYTHPEAGWDNRATRFKVHLGLKEFAKLRED